MENIKIVQYEDMSKVEEPFLKTIAEQEREAWGYQGVGEYAVCTDPECRALQSIDEVYGVNGTDKYVPLAELEKNGPKIPDCPECNSPSQIAMPPDHYVDFLRDYYSKGVYGALLIDEETGQVEGNGVSFKDTIANIFDNNINYRKTYDREHWLAAIACLLGKEYGCEGKEEAICFNRMVISRAIKGGGYFGKLFTAMLDIHPEYDDLPLIGDTRFDSVGWPLIKAIGNKDVIWDHMGWVTHMNERSGNMRELLGLEADEFKKHFHRKLQLCREMRKKYIETHKPHEQRKYYKGVPLL